MACRCTSPTRPTCRSSRSRWSIRCWSRATDWSRIRRSRQVSRWQGLRRVMRPVDHSCVFNGALERAVHQPWGIFGGGRRVGPLPARRSRKGGAVNAWASSPMVIVADQTIVIESPGAGGYGPAAERCSREAIERDRVSGKFSRPSDAKDTTVCRGQECSAVREHWNWRLPAPRAVLELDMTDGAHIPRPPPRQPQRAAARALARQWICHRRLFPVLAPIPGGTATSSLYDQRNHGQSGGTPSFNTPKSRWPGTWKRCGRDRACIRCAAHGRPLSFPRPS